MEKCAKDLTKHSTRLLQSSIFLFDKILTLRKNKRIFQQSNATSLIPIRVLRELKVLCHLHHPNIVNLSAVIIPESYEDFTDIYMVMELMQADLRDLLVCTCCKLTRL
jgi:serine/threonine protein kinase